MPIETPIDASGLNRAEASFLAAAVRFGDAPDLVEAIESGPASALRTRLEATVPLGAEARRQCASELAKVARGAGDEGRISSKLLAADGVHFDALQSFGTEEFRQVAGDFGAFQLAELLRDKNRREIARVASRFAPSRRMVVFGALRRKRDCERLERIRIREVFVSFSEHVEEFGRRVARLGLYSIACSAGRRYRERVEQLADRLPREIGGRLRRYYRLAYGSTRRGVGRRFRRAFAGFLVWRCESQGKSIDGDTGGDGG